MLPWTHLHITPTGLTAPCCISTTASNPKIDNMTQDSISKKEPVKTPEVKKQDIKKPEIKNEIKTEPKTEILTSGIASFKVQLSASGKKIELVPSNFYGLSNISITSEGNLYKYMYGETTNYDEAKRLLSEAKSKGYSSAFLIAFKNGKKVSVQDALKQ